MENENDFSKEMLEKMNFAPGVPDDVDAIPQRLFQVLFGRVYTLTRWKDGSTARGEIPLEDLEKLFGGPIAKEGWYDVLGTYLGPELEGSL